MGKHFTETLNKVELRINRAQPVLDNMIIIYDVTDDVHGQHCAVLSSIPGYGMDYDGTFELQGRDCDQHMTTLCSRTTFFREVVLGPDWGPADTLLWGTFSEVQQKCQDIGME